MFFFGFSWFSGPQKTRKIRKNIDFALKNTAFSCFFSDFPGFPGFRATQLAEASQPLGFPDFKEKPGKSGKILILHCKTPHSGTFFRIFLVFHRNQENLEAAGARLVKVPENQENQENQKKY